MAKTETQSTTTTPTGKSAPRAPAAPRRKTSRSQASQDAIDNSLDLSRSSEGVFVGHPSVLVKAGIRLNGVPLDPSALTHLRKYSFGAKGSMMVVDYIRPAEAGVKGKRPEVVQLTTMPGNEFTMAE